MLRPLYLLPWRRRCTFLFLTFLPLATGAQAWQWVDQYGGTANASCEVVTIDAGGAAYAGGTYEAILPIAGEELTSLGGDDIWIARFEAGGQLLWAATAGGFSDESITAMTVAPDGDLICAGSYWERAFFEDQELVAQANIKGLFVARYTPAGNLRWVKGIDGTRLKEVTDLQCDRAGNIYLSGFFEEQLLVDEAVLQSNGVSDLFLLQLDGQGRLGWAIHEGLTGNTRALSLAVTPEEDLVVGGYFDDTTRIIGETFAVSSFMDREVFLARYSKTGEGQWARMAGGVLPNDISSVAVDAGGDIYVAGWLVGVMNLSEELRIESQTGQSDFYLLRYAADGTPLVGRAMGNPEFPQEATDLLCTEEGVVLSGFYQGVMTIDGSTVSAGGGFGSFIAGFSPDADLRWIKNMPADEAILVNTLTRTTEGRLFTGGDFLGKVRLDGFELETAGAFGFYLGALAPQATDLETPPAAGTPLHVFPIPAAERVTLQTEASEFSVFVYDLQGRQVLATRNQREISLAGVPPGSYLLVYQDAKGLQRRRLLISR